MRPPPSETGFSRDAEEKRTKLFSGAFLVLGVPLFLMFACLHLSSGETLRGAVLAFLGFGFICLFFWLKRTVASKWVYRGCLGLLGCFSLYLVILSGILGDTHRLLFLILVPLFAFFSLGKREGLIWTTAFVGLWLPLFLAPIPLLGTFPPLTSFLLRFLTTFLVVTASAYVFESERERYQRAMQREHGRLQAEITERRRFEQVLTESEKRFREFAELLPEIVFEARVDGILDFVNRNAFQVTGYTPEDVAFGFEAIRLIAPEDRERASLNMLRRMEGQEVESTEYTAIRKNGERFTVLVRSVPILRGDEIVGLRGILVDITEQKLAQKALKEAKQFSDSIIDSLPGNFYVLSEDGNVLLWNKHVERVSGYSPEEIATVSPEIFFVVEEREEVKAQIRKAFQEGGLDFETRVLTKDGREIPHHYRGVTARIGGRNLLIGHGVDIAARKEAEKEKARLESRLKQAAKMEAVGTLAGGIAHDFNNVLAVITGFTELAMIEAKDARGQRENLEEVLEASKRAKGLVEQILTFSRQGERERSPVELHRIVKDTLRLVRENLPSAIEMRQQLKAESESVSGNVVELHQVIMNLCRNAEQAMGETGGILEVCLSEETVTPDEAERNLELRPGNYLRLAITDTGKGIPREVVDRIFDPFFTTRAPGEGTGMGLSVVHGVVSRYGGAITVSSEVDEGSTFTVWLPKSEGITRPADSTAEPPGEASVPCSRETILVVDDEDPIRRLLRRILEDEGFQVFEAADGKEAIQLQAAEPADFVITDIFMPEADGFETIREIRELSSEVGIIAISGGGKTVKEDLLPYAKMLGADRILAKPLARKELMQAIQEIRAAR